MNLHAAPAWTLQGARTCTFNIIKHSYNLLVVENLSVPAPLTISQSLTSKIEQSASQMEGLEGHILIKEYWKIPALHIIIQRQTTTMSQLLLSLRIKREETALIKTQILLTMSRILIWSSQNSQITQWGPNIRVYSIAIAKPQGLVNT